MRKVHRVFPNLLFLMAFYLLLTAEGVNAKAFHMILITSPLNTHTIEIRAEQHAKITIIARIDREGVRFQWKLHGPGR